MSQNTQTDLNCIEIDPSNPATRTIIVLHGLGADANDFVPIVPDLQLPPELNIRFIFPTAPTMPITINNGYEMHAWYDIYGIAIAGQIDTSGIALSQQRINRLIEKEIARGVAAKNIILAGFSQGAAMALTTGLLYPEKIAGIIALSGYLPATEDVLAQASTANQATPIFLAHGTQDPIVPYTLGKAVHSALSHTHHAVTWQSYPMPHSVCAEEVNDISAWIKEVFKN